MRRLAAAAMIAVTLAMGLTGCGRFAQGDGPSPAVSTPASDAVEGSDVDDVLDDLDAVDDAVTQADEDGVAGDDAAATDDTP